MDNKFASMMRGPRYPFAPPSPSDQTDEIAMDTKLTKAYSLNYELNKKILNLLSNLHNLMLLVKFGLLY